MDFVLKLKLQPGNDYNDNDYKVIEFDESDLSCEISRCKNVFYMAAM